MPITKIGVGTDIIEINRLKERDLKTHLTFYRSIFTKSELKYSLKYSDPYPHLAGIYAAKEAIIKCYGKPLRMIDIEIIRDTYGKPIAVTSLKRKNLEVSLSISHSRSVAMAVAISILKTL